MNTKTISLTVPYEYCVPQRFFSAPPEEVAEILTNGIELLLHKRKIVSDEIKKQEYVQLEQQYQTELQKLQSILTKTKEENQLLANQVNILAVQVQNAQSNGEKLCRQFYEPQIDKLRKDLADNDPEKYFQDRVIEIRKLYEQQIHDMKFSQQILADTINKLRQDLSANNPEEYFQSRSDEIRNSCEQRINDMKISQQILFGTIDGLRKELVISAENSEKRYQRQIEDFRNSCEQRINDIKNSQQSVTGIVEKLDQISGTAAKKGKLGESIIENIIYTLYPHATIKNVTKESGLGDLIAIIDGVDIMFEVKNVAKHVDADDVKKFRRDASNTLASGAIMTVLSDSTISDIGNAGIEFINKGNVKIPCIYISSVAENNELIRIAVDIITKLNIIQFSDDDDNNIDQKIQNFSNTFNTLIQIFNETIHDAKTFAKQATDIIHISEAIANRSLNALQSINSTLNELSKSQVQPVVEKDRISIYINMMITYLSTNPNEGVSEKTIKASGITWSHIKNDPTLGVKGFKKLVEEQMRKNATIVASKKESTVVSSKKELATVNIA